MNKTAEKITTIEDGQELILLDSAITEYKIPDMTLKTIALFREAEILECVDPASRKVLGKHRVDVKALISSVETKRLDNNREYKEKNNTHAELLKGVLGLSRDIFDGKIKAYDSIAETKRLAKAKIEKERLDKLAAFIEHVGLLATAGLQYDRSTEGMENDLENLEAFEISAVDFEERTEEAERIKAQGLVDTKKFLENRVKWENDQVEQAQVKKDQEAEAKRLADEKAKFAFEQAKARAEQKNKDDAVALIIAQEAGKVRQANEKLEADRKALEKEKAEIEAEKQADEYQKKALKQFNLDHAEAIEHHETYLVLLAQEMDLARLEAKNRWEAGESDRKKALKANKVRTKAIASDKKKIQKTINQIDKMISEIKPLEYGTDEGAQVIFDLYVRLKEALSLTEQDGVKLV